MIVFYMYAVLWASAPSSLPSVQPNNSRLQLHLASDLVPRLPNPIRAANDYLASTSSEVLWAANDTIIILVMAP